MRVTVIVDTETDRESISVHSNLVNVQFSDGSAIKMPIIEWRELNAAIECAIGAHDAAMEFVPDEATQ